MVRAGMNRSFVWNLISDSKIIVMVEDNYILESVDGICQKNLINTLVTRFLEDNRIQIKYNPEWSSGRNP